MTRDELDLLWGDPDNWGIVYRCAEDPRVIVPRRRRWMGWTLNFAHRLAWPVFMLCVAVAVGPVLVLLDVLEIQLMTNHGARMILFPTDKFAGPSDE